MQVPGPMLPVIVTGIPGGCFHVVTIGPAAHDRGAVAGRKKHRGPLTPEQLKEVDELCEVWRWVVDKRQALEEELASAEAALKTGVAEIACWPESSAAATP